jgi:hypothetical protein
VPPDNRRADDRALFHFAGFQNLNDTWQARAQLNWISDPRYLEDFNNKLDSSTAFEITSTIGVFGHGRYWDASLTGNYHQLADYTLSERGCPSTGCRARTSAGSSRWDVSSPPAWTPKPCASRIRCSPEAAASTSSPTSACRWKAPAGS